MKAKQYSEEQISFALKQAEFGTSVEDVIMLPIVKTTSPEK
jgi:hypothetical protein